MTRQEFQAAYVLGQRITSDGVTTSLAQEVRKGRLVMVHELSTTTPAEAHRLTILLGQLSKRDASQVLANLEVDEERVIVTRFLLGFTSLREWMERAVAESSTFVADTKENPPTMDLAIHDVPRRYTPTEQEAITPSLQDTSIGMPGDRTPLPTPATKDDVIIKAPRSTEPSGEPGFTELFGALDPSGSRPPPPPSSAPVTRPPPSPLSAGDQDPGNSDETGGFTRLFGEDASIPPRQAVPAQSPPTPTPIATEPPAPPTRAPVTPAPTPAPTARRPEERVLKEEAGDPATGGFTQLFGEGRDRGIVSASEDALPRISPPRLPSAPPATPAAPSVSDRKAAPGPPRLNLSALEGAPSAGRPPTPHGEPVGHAPGSGLPVTPLPLSVPARPSDRGPAPDVFVERAVPERNLAPPFSNPGGTPARGSYTEVLTPARPPLAPAPPRPTPAQAASPPPPPRPSLAPLIIILTVLLVLAVAIVIVFAWRHR
jgi:hypothetical protein